VPAHETDEEESGDRHDPDRDAADERHRHDLGDAVGEPPARHPPRQAVE